MDAKEIRKRIEAPDKAPKKKRFGGMEIGSILGVMISLVVGISFISSMENGNGASNGEEIPEAYGDLVNILIYVFIVVVIVGALVWLKAGRGEEGDEEKVLDEADEIRRLQRRNRRHLIYRG